MRDRLPNARTRLASGRFLCALVLVAGCQTVGGGAVGRDAGPPSVVLATGPVSEAAEREAERLLQSARVSFEARRFFEVLRTTDEIVTSYAATRVSGEALRLAARAHARVGQMAAADSAAARYLSLLDPGDPRGTELRLLQAETLVGEEVEQLDRLLRIDGAATPDEVARATELARAAVDSVTLEELERVVARVASRGPIMPVVEARLAVSLLEMGRESDAVAYARRAIDGRVTGDELVWAQGVLEGELPPGRGRVTSFRIGAVLPESGPPALADYARLIREGIEVAVATVLGEEYVVTLEARDDEGDPLRAAHVVAELDSGGVVGIVGLLQDQVLLAAGKARADPVPLVSPTARSADGAGTAVYSLEGADPAAAERVATYAAVRAFQRVAMLYPDNPAARAEADAFEARARALGIPVVGRFVYQAGATFFEPQIIGARDALRADELAELALAEDDTLHMEVLEPAALFMPIPPEDVTFLAPQVIHFGLDTLAIEILGTTGWSDPQTLSAVEPRLTTGVVATAPVGVEPDAPGPTRFREAYEAHFRRSLVSPAPAVGYDATLLLLEALRPGRVGPEQLEASFASLRSVEGATGVLSIVDGGVVRETRLVRIDRRTPVPLEIEDIEVRVR